MLAAQEDGVRAMQQWLDKAVRKGLRAALQKWGAWAAAAASSGGASPSSAAAVAAASASLPLPATAPAAAGARAPMESPAVAATAAATGAAVVAGGGGMIVTRKPGRRYSNPDLNKDMAAKVAELREDRLKVHDRVHGDRSEPYSSKGRLVALVVVHRSPSGLLWRTSKVHTPMH
jgi:hypothetical protein